MSKIFKPENYKYMSHETLVGLACKQKENIARLQAELDNLRAENNHLEEELANTHALLVESERAETTADEYNTPDPDKTIPVPLPDDFLGDYDPETDKWDSQNT